MPTSLKSGSMPKVRASSGMIGTIRGPSSGSRMRFRSRRVNAIVVETAMSDSGGELGWSTSGLGEGSASARTTPLRQRAAEGPAPLV